MTAEFTRIKLAAQTTRKSLAIKSLPPPTPRWTRLTMKLWIQNAHRLSLSNLIASAMFLLSKRNRILRSPERRFKPTCPRFRPVTIAEPGVNQAAPTLSEFIGMSWEILVQSPAAESSITNFLVDVTSRTIQPPYWFPSSSWAMPSVCSGSLIIRGRVVKYIFQDRHILLSYTLPEVVIPVAESFQLTFSAIALACRNSSR